MAMFAPENPDTKDIVDPQTLQFRRAVADAKQAYDICKRLIQDNRTRTQNMAKIQIKLNDEQPWNQAQLEAAGEGWRNNRSTGYLSSTMRRAMIPYRKQIDQARVMTFSKLKAPGPEAMQKSEAFRQQTTKTIRQWDSWDDFVNLIILEDVNFGKTGAGYIDEHDWHPLFLRGDESFFPIGCPQNANKVPLWMFKQEVLPHELADKLTDPNLSAQVGWNIDNLVKAINTAKPASRAENAQEQARGYQDLVRENNLGASYSMEVKTIQLYHLFAMEANGKVSHYVLNGVNGDELFMRPDRFAAMEDCLALITLEVGNGKYYGSKGAAQILYNTSVSIEQARNLVMDNQTLAGLILLKGTLKGKKQATISVMNPVCVISPDFEVVPVEIKGNAESFMELDRYMTSLGEMQIGMFTPSRQMGDDSNETASKTNLIASVEMQVTEGVLLRFWKQFLQVVFMMQRRMYSPSNINAAMAAVVQEQQANAMGQQFNLNMSGYLNADAVESCIALLKEGLTPEEILELAHCPPNEATQDLAAMNPQVTGQVFSQFLNDTFVDQMQLRKMHLSATLGNDTADHLLNPDMQDGTVQAENIRQQLLEWTSMLQGEQIPVSPRDADLTHLGVMKEKGTTILGQITPESMTGDIVPLIENLIAHGESHIQSAHMKKLDPSAIGEFEQFFGAARKLLENAKMMIPNGPQSKLQVPPGTSPAAAPQHMGHAPAPINPPKENVMPAMPYVPGADGMPLSQGPIPLQPPAPGTGLPV